MAATIHPVLEVLIAFLLLTGVGLNVAAAVGLHRFPDVLTRMHAASKPAMLGVVSALVAAALALGNLDAAMKLALVAGLQLATTPTGSHMVGRAVWKDRSQIHPDTTVF